MSHLKKHQVKNNVFALYLSIKGTLLSTLHILYFMLSEIYRFRLKSILLFGNEYFNLINSKKIDSAEVENILSEKLNQSLLEV